MLRRVIACRSFFIPIVCITVTFVFFAVVIEFQLSTVTALMIYFVDQNMKTKSFLSISDDIFISAMNLIHVMLAVRTRIDICVSIGEKKDKNDC